MSGILNMLLGVAPAAGGGTPTGNAFTIVSYSGAENSGAPTGPAGSTGDILAIFFKWEGTGTLTGISGATSGAATLRGTAINHSNNDLHCRFATLVTTTGTGEVLTATVTSGGFFDWGIWRITATGTKDFTQANGGTGTSGSVSTGSVTSITNNGLALVGRGVYGASTPSAQQVAGNNATNTRAFGGSSSSGWDYTHTSQIIGSGTCTQDSIEWVASILDCSAQ